MASKQDEHPSSPHEYDSDSSDSSSDDRGILEALLARLTLGGSPPSKPVEPPTKVLPELTVEALADAIKAGKFKNIIVMTGAGISTSAGIPDFRSPGTGLYDNLQKYNLPTPEAIFQIDYLRERPEAFFTLAKELFPGKYKATPCHYFIRLLHEKKVLLRNFTQNIDTLELVAGIPEEKLVFAHGSFSTSHCIDCHKEYSTDWVKDKIFADTIPKCTVCDGIVKPDIVFFGESLPERFFTLLRQDFPMCDLLIVIGTSLRVQPFAGLIDMVKSNCPRLLINKEKVGERDPRLHALGIFSGGFNFGEGNYRDIAMLGDCDTQIRKLVELIGWTDDLNKLIEEGRDKAIAFSLAPETPAIQAEKGEEEAKPSETAAVEEPAAPASENKEKEQTTKEEETPQTSVSQSDGNSKEEEKIAQRSDDQVPPVEPKL